MDTVSTETRSAIMRAVGRRDTTPELVVRRTLFAMGFRFRLHRRDLPGTPDIVLPKWRTAIFVHGCFWHRHRNCRFATVPHTRKRYWQEKFQRNRERDQAVASRLRKKGWRVLVVWECETRSADTLARRFRADLL